MNTLIRLQKRHNSTRPVTHRAALLGELLGAGGHFSGASSHLSGVRAELTDDLLSSVFAPSATSQAEIRLDVAEDDKVYRVWLAIPGVKKEDIQLAVEKNTVSVSVEVKGETMQEGERVLRAERFVGNTSRSFALAQEIDEAAVQARYADGVLTLLLPKKLAAPAKRITIN